MHFADLNFSNEIQSTLNSKGFIETTPIQEKAIPVVREGRDVIGLAQTGTGKTAAFVLPIIEKLARSQSRFPRALVIAPTRELAEQIHEVFRSFAKPFGLRSITAYGGVGLRSQIQELKKGVDIIVGCPGRILDHLENRHMNLSKLEFLVLDEADQMFDLGFLPTVRRIMGYVPKQRQTLLFSATMPPDVSRLAQEIVTNPEIIRAGKIAPASTVSHALYPVAQHLKTERLSRILKSTDSESVLVFVRTKHRAKKLSEGLNRRGFKATSLQGNLSQNARQTAMSGFRSGRFQILVATDIAARGIDISTVSHVINFDIPDTVEAYTHRIGRTGRASRKGDAFTLVVPQDRGMVRSIERVLGSAIERKMIEGFDYNVSLPPATDGGNSRFSRDGERSNRSGPRPSRDEQRPYRGGRRSNNQRTFRPPAAGADSRSPRMALLPVAE